MTAHGNLARKVRCADGRSKNSKEVTPSHTLNSSPGRCELRGADWPQALIEAKEGNTTEGTFPREGSDASYCVSRAGQPRAASQAVHVAHH